MSTIPDIKNAVALAFGTRLIEMTSSRRARNVARPRQVAMYLARNLTKLSLPAIGVHFGNRDHSTVMHAVWRVEKLMTEDDEFARKVAEISRNLAQARHQPPLVAPLELCAIEHW